ncbi:MAG: cell division protein FtsZ [Bacteroidota bacterium]
MVYSEDLIANVARELGILTVAIVTIPFSFEGRKRKQHAEEGIAELKRHVDAILVIRNDKLRELYGNLTLRAAFGHADDVLSIAAKGIAELITVTGHINVDFEDVKTVMKDSGSALMGVGIANGENRAYRAIEDAMCSPLLNDDNVTGAKNILLYISSGKEEITMDEVTEITEYIQTKTKSYTEVIWGNGIDDSLDDKISVTVIATGFEDEPTSVVKQEIKAPRIIHSLDGKSGVVIEEHKTQRVAEEPVAEEKLETTETPVFEIKAKPFDPSFFDPKPQSVEKDEEFDEETFSGEGRSSISSFSMETEEEMGTGTSMFPEENQIEEEAYVTDAPADTSFESQRMLVFDLIRDEQKGQSAIEPEYEQPAPKLTPELLVFENPSSAQNHYEEMNMVNDNEPDLDKIRNDRKTKLKTLSEKLKTHNASLETHLYEIERVPAYKRRNVSLNDVTPSSENQVPHYHVPGNQEKPINENPYLHNKPD